MKECIQLFTNLCQQAFKPRPAMSLPGVRILTRLAHEGSKYKTTPLTDVLRKNFKDQPLFGGKQKRSSGVVKVAVTATSETMQSSMILTNYNRPLPPENLPQRKTSCYILNMSTDLS